MIIETGKGYTKLETMAEYVKAQRRNPTYIVWTHKPGQQFQIVAYDGEVVKRCYRNYYLDLLRAEYIMFKANEQYIKQLEAK